MPDINDSEAKQEVDSQFEEAKTFETKKGERESSNGDTKTGLDHQTKRIDTYLSLLTAINNGIEDLLGAASKGIIFNTGVEEGRRLGEGISKTNTLKTAIEIVNNAYEGIWGVELYDNQEDASLYFEDEYGRTSFRIIVRECPVRAAVTSKNLRQSGPLCHLSNGYLCGMMDEILGEKVGVEIEHTGPLACKKRMFFRK